MRVVPVRRRFNINVSGSVGQRARGPRTAPRADTNYYSIFTCLYRVAGDAGATRNAHRFAPLACR